MNKLLKELIAKNSSAYKHHFYIESAFLSYSVLQKGIKHICVEEKLISGNKQLKLNEGLKLLDKHYTDNPLFTKKLKKATFKLIVDYNSEIKKLIKELKYQLPTQKINKLTKEGITAVTQLNTTLIRFHSNKRG